METSMSNAQGYIFYNKQRKKWNAQYYIYDEKIGKDIRKTKSFKTEDEAKKFLSTIMYQRNNPIFIEKNGIPLVDLMRSELKLKYDSNLISPVQYARVLYTINRIGETAIGNKNIDTITMNELQAYMNNKKYLSNSSISKIYGQFNQIFRTALNKGYIMYNPMVNVIKPKSDKEDKIVRALTVEEQKNFTDYLVSKSLSECKYKNVFLIQLYMGLRCGEALALSLGDIDLKSKRANIRRTLTMSETGAIMMGNTTKTYAGKRIVPIPDFLLPHIIEQINDANSKENNDERLLFKSDIGAYMSRNNVNSELRRIMKKQYGITDISTHSLRHSYGTRCIESGMAPVVVQKLMGHKDITVTLNTYTSVYDIFKAREVEKVNNYYIQESLVNNLNMLDEKNIEDDEIGGDEL